MADSPMRAVLSAMDALDLDALMALFAPDIRLGMAFGGDAVGLEQVRGELGWFFSELRSARHDVGSTWNPEPGVWISEMSATYELKDFSERGPYRRAMILRAGDGGIRELRMYGEHEPPLPETGRPYNEVRGPRGWLPTL